ncbi:MAG: hypothetical protein ABI472_23720 [Ginsengibacter sp.]
MKIKQYEEVADYGAFQIVAIGLRLPTFGIGAFKLKQAYGRLATLRQFGIRPGL